MSDGQDIRLTGLGADLAADRVVLHWHRRGILVVADQWHSRRCAPLPPSAGVPADTARRWLQLLENGGTLVIPDVSDMDDDWAAERAVLRNAGAAAVLAVPVRDSDDVVVGSLALHVEEPRAWTSTEMGVLRDVAADIVDRADREASRTSAVAISSFEDLPLAMAVLDAEGTTIAGNAAARAIGVRPGSTPRPGLDGVTDLSPTAARLVQDAVRPIVEGRAQTGSTTIEVYGTSIPVRFQKVGDGVDAEILAVALPPDDGDDEGRRIADLVAGGHVDVAYQPLLDPAGQLVGFEALCRPTDPDVGPLDPSEFVRRAEVSGAISVLDRAVFARTLHDWHDLAAVLPAPVRDRFVLSVNLGADSLLTGFAAHAAEQCASNGVAPSMLQLELTETELLYDPRGIAELSVLARAGFRLSLDDFGSGYSSFAYLAELPVHAVKLDRSLVVAGAADARARRVAQGVCRLARDLGLAIYAEGIETDRERRLVWELGCDAWQGFLCAKAMPIDELVSLVERDATQSLRSPRLVAPAGEPGQG